MSGRLRIKNKQGGSFALKTVDIEERNLRVGGCKGILVRLQGWRSDW